MNPYFVIGDMMTDKTRDQIGDMIANLQMDADSIAGRILAIPQIKEGQELREKAESGKLVELSEDQSLPPRLYWGGAGFTEEAVKNDMLRAGFRRVKVKG